MISSRKAEAEIAKHRPSLFGVIRRNRRKFRHPSVAACLALRQYPRQDHRVVKDGGIDDQARALIFDVNALVQLLLAADLGSGRT